MKFLISIMYFSILFFAANVFSHGGGEGEGAQIGPDKGVTEKGPLGFKLSDEAIKTIGFKTADYTAPMEIPKEAIASAKSEKFFYRLRDGWYKSVPLDHKDLKENDKIIISKLGFLRIIEVYVQGGGEEEEGHDD
ncbi:MAG: hypothetical protein IPM57_08735 [Oligoflexia bacterium]|nr:hypothetical protein [Oligoflexia bacterium]